MYQIVICDDESSFIIELKTILMQYANDTGKEFVFYEFRLAS